MITLKTKGAKMKHFIITTLGIVALAHPSFARHGGTSGGNADIIVRGSQAWFAAESAEQVVEGLVRENAVTESGLDYLRISLTSTANAELTLSSSAGDLTKNCQMTDESSRRGTLTKKDVRCAGIAKTPRYDLTRGSDAWAVVEGLEHSLRLAVMGDATVLGTLKSATSELQDDSSVLISFDLSNGSRLDYTCTRTYYGAPNPLSIECVSNN